MVKKESCGYYKGYDMYLIVDAAKQKHYMATSVYLTEGFVTRTSDTLEGLKLEIDKTIQRIKPLRLSSRVRKL